MDGRISGPHDGLLEIGSGLGQGGQAVCTPKDVFRSKTARQSAPHRPLLSLSVPSDCRLLAVVIAGGLSYLHQENVVPYETAVGGHKF